MSTFQLRYTSGIGVAAISRSMLCHKESKLAMDFMQIGQDSCLLRSISYTRHATISQLCPRCCEVTGSQHTIKLTTTHDKTLLCSTSPHMVRVTHMSACYHTQKMKAQCVSLQLCRAFICIIAGHKWLELRCKCIGGADASAHCNSNYLLQGMACSRGKHTSTYR